MLALSMLLTPVFGSVELPAFTLTVDGTATQQQDLSFGVTETTGGEPVVFLSHWDDGCYITTDGLTFTANDAAYTISAHELARFIASAANQLPQPTEEDLQAVALLGRELLASITPDSFSFVPRGDGFALYIDVDHLLAEIDSAVPQLLRTHARQLNPTLQKYSAFLLGMPITANDLAELWPALGLGELRTGLTINLSVIPTANGVNVMGSVAQFSFVARILEDGFELRFTTPDGVVYPLDSADFLTLVDVFADLPLQVLASSITAAMNETGDTITIQIDTTLLARNLNNAIAGTISANADVVDALLQKYSPWLALVSPELTNLSAAALNSLFAQQQPIALPAITGQVSVTDAHPTYTIDGSFVGPFGALTFTGRLQNGSRSALNTLTVILDDGRETFRATLNHTLEDNMHRVTLAFSQPVLGLFRTLTFNLDTSSYGPCIDLSTDTDTLRLAWHPDYIRVNLLGFSACYRYIRGVETYMHLALYDLFITLTSTDSSLLLDSTYFGLNARAKDNAFILSGYFTPDQDVRYDFGLDCHPGVGNIGLYHGFVSGDDTDLSFTLSDHSLFVTVDDTAYSLIPQADNNSLVLYRDDEALMTILGQANGDAYTLLFYEGQDLTALRFTIVLDLDPAPITLPTRCRPIDVYTLIDALSDALY